MVEKFKHEVLGEIEVSNSPRAKRVSISVKPGGGVRLTVPRRVALSRAVEFLNTKVAWIVKARQRMSMRQTALPQSLSPEEQHARIEQLRRLAKADLPQRIERISQLTGLKYRSLAIRATKTKWGSCSGENVISLSLFLMTLPEHLRDYVIVHELCHTVHHNHSPKFHALLDRLVGGRDAELQRELRHYTIRG